MGPHYREVFATYAQLPVPPGNRGCAHTLRIRVAHVAVIAATYQPQSDVFCHVYALVNTFCHLQHICNTYARITNYLRVAYALHISNRENRRKEMRNE